MNANKVALITSGHKRIGLAISKALHQKNYSVAIHYRSGEREAKHLETELNENRPNSAKVFYADLQSQRDAETLIKQVLSWHKKLNVLVNNASVFIKTSDETLEQDFEKQFTSNVKAPFLLSMSAYPHLKISEGNIINITDIHGHKPLKDYSHYSMSKAALIMQTKALALEFGPNVRVNSVAPGLTLWPEGDNELNKETKEKLLNKTCLKRGGNPKNIAQAVLSLLDNDYVTGMDLPVDGGRLCTK